MNRTSREIKRAHLNARAEAEKAREELKILEWESDRMLTAATEYRHRADVLRSEWELLLKKSKKSFTKGSNLIGKKIKKREEVDNLRRKIISWVLYTPYHGDHAFYTRADAMDFRSRLMIHPDFDVNNIMGDLPLPEKEIGCGLLPLDTIDFDATVEKCAAGVESDSSESEEEYDEVEFSSDDDDDESEDSSEDD